MYKDTVLKKKKNWNGVQKNYIKNFIYFTKNFPHFSMKDDIFLTLHPILSQLSYLHESFPKFLSVHRPGRECGSAVLLFRTLAEFWHWFVANIPGDSVDDGDVVFDLLFPLVLPEGSGDHRYYT